MDKRTFLKTQASLIAGGLLLPVVSCTPSSSATRGLGVISPAADGSYSLPALDYAFNALEPYIDARTMEIHHDLHHAGYVNKLNKALTEINSEGSLNDLLSGLKDRGATVSIRNNGGGHYNHSLFWKILGPGPKEVPGVLREALTQSFGSVDTFKKALSDVGKTRFGSGWAWLIKDPQGNLKVTSTPNQDNPLMTHLVEDPGTPLLGIDVWEHAYYLNYQNRRGAYLDAIWNVIDWDRVASRLGS